MDPVVDVALRGGLALLLVVAATHKARDVAAFRATLANYRILPPRATPLAAILVPGAEATTAAALLVAPARAAGPFLAAMLITAYTGAIVINLARGRRDIDCGCSARAVRQPLSGWLVARNVALVATALACLPAPRTRPLLWMDAVTIAGALAALASLHGALERMMALRRAT